MYDIGQSKYIKEFLHDPAFLPLDVSVVYLFGKPENIINMLILILERRFTCNTKKKPNKQKQLFIYIPVYINVYPFIQWYSIIFTSILNNIYLYTYLLYFQVYQTDTPH
jgi:hypothetical protein